MIDPAEAFGTSSHIVICWHAAPRAQNLSQTEVSPNCAALTERITRASFVQQQTITWTAELAVQSRIFRVSLIAMALGVAFAAWLREFPSSAAFGEHSAVVSWFLSDSSTNSDMVRHTRLVGVGLRRAPRHPVQALCNKHCHGGGF